MYREPCCEGCAGGSAGCGPTGLGQPAEAGHGLLAFIISGLIVGAVWDLFR